MAKAKLTPKQKKFADEYLKCGNASEAYKRAGYKTYKSANVEAGKSLKNPKIKAYIEDHQKRMNKKAIADIDEVMTFFSETMRGNVKDQFDLDAALPERLNAGKEIIKRLQVVDNLSQKNAELENELKQARLDLIKAQTEQVKGGNQVTTEDKVAKLFNAIGGALDDES